MACTIVCGSQYGDEGKGKVAAYIAFKDSVDYSVRGGVGPNAGHGVVYGGTEFECRHIPAGFVCVSANLRLGPGSLVDPEVLVDEMERLERSGIPVRNRFRLDGNCGVVDRRHVEEERTDRYLHSEIGSMISGCGRANAERVLRKLRIAKDTEILSKFISDVPMELNRALEEGKSVLIEGTQGFGLSLYHGIYPYVTSKDTSASTLAGDVGISPFRVKEIVLVMKPYVTRAGMGPLKHEAFGDPSIKESEVRPGVVIGSQRRIAGFDWALVERAVMVNCPSQVALTNLDRRWPENQNAKSFEELSGDAQEFVNEIEKRLKVPVTLISTGPELESTIDRRA